MTESQTISPGWPGAPDFLTHGSEGMSRTVGAAAVLSLSSCPVRPKPDVELGNNARPNNLLPQRPPQTQPHTVQLRARLTKSQSSLCPRSLSTCTRARHLRTPEIELNCIPPPAPFPSPPTPSPPSARDDGARSSDVWVRLFNYLQHKRQPVICLLGGSPSVLERNARRWRCACERVRKQWDGSTDFTVSTLAFYLVINSDGTCCGVGWVGSERVSRGKGPVHGEVEGGVVMTSRSTSRSASLRAAPFS